MKNFLFVCGFIIVAVFAMAQNARAINDCGFVKSSLYGDALPIFWALGYCE